MFVYVLTWGTPLGDLSTTPGSDSVAGRGMLRVLIQGDLLFI